jgi:hypothetical protein
LAFGTDEVQSFFIPAPSFPHGLTADESAAIRALLPCVDGNPPLFPLPCARSAREGEGTILPYFPGWRPLRVLTRGYSLLAPPGRRQAALCAGKVGLAAVCNSMRSRAPRV